MPKKDFESTNFANFEEVVHNFGRSDDDICLVKKMLISHKCIHGLMPNLIKKSWMVSNLTCGTVVLHEFHGRQDFGTLSGFRDAQVV